MSLLYIFLPYFCILLMCGVRMLYVFFYCIFLQIVYWDSQSVFLEHRFITPKDNFVNAVAISRIRMINCNAEDVMKELLEKSKLQDSETARKIEKPEIPLEVARWIESNEISSSKLRNGI